MTDYYSLLTGYPIYIATQEFQRRKHKKKRINKKWRKRYGTVELNSMPHGEIIFNEVDRVFYMTKKTLQEVERRLDGNS